MFDDSSDIDMGWGIFWFWGLSLERRVFWTGLSSSGSLGETGDLGSETRLNRLVRFIKLPRKQNESAKDMPRSHAYAMSLPGMIRLLELPKKKKTGFTSNKQAKMKNMFGEGREKF